jgi:hypothetical protein
MDLLTALFGGGSIAFYLLLRERSFRLAILAASSMITAGVLTHPLAAVYAPGLALSVLILDWRKIRPSTVLLTLLPIAVGFGLWGMYILQDVPAFRAQLVQHSTDRIPQADQYFNMVWFEFKMRYGQHYLSEGLSKLKVLIVAAFWLAIPGAVLLREFRREPRYLAIWFATWNVSVWLTLLDRAKFSLYLVHPFQFFILNFGILCWLLLQRGGAWRRLAVAGIAMIVVLNIGGMVYRAGMDVRAMNYEPSIATIHQHTQPGDTVIGGAELAFGLKPDRKLVDDCRLGYYSGVEPTVIALNGFYGRPRKDHESDAYGIHAYRYQLLETKYDVVFENSAYKIYRRKAR